MMRLIRPLWFVPFMLTLTLIAASPASAQRTREINALNTLPESPTLIGKTIEIVLEYQTEGSPVREGARIFTKILDVVDQRAVPSVASSFWYMLAVKFDYPQTDEEAWALAYDRDFRQWLLWTRRDKSSSRGEPIANLILH